jgi:hypothetical protein
MCAVTSCGRLRHGDGAHAVGDRRRRGECRLRSRLAKAIAMPGAGTRHHKDVLDKGLPEKFTPDLYNQKCDLRQTVQ